MRLAPLTDAASTTDMRGEPRSKSDGRARRHERSDAEPPAIDAIDVLDGFCGLERRSPTLDGSVPLRAASACSPLLEGNAYGFQIVLRKRIELRHGALGLRVVNTEQREDTERALRAVLPALVARGIVESDNADGLAEGYLRPAAPLSRRLVVFTGLLVRPRADARLRLSSTANRRPMGVRVRERFFEDSTQFRPLVLELELDLDSAVTLEGEVATLAALPRVSSFAMCDIASAPEVVEAHLNFYDRAYFAQKKLGRSTRKYRRLVERAAPAQPTSTLPASTTLVAQAGPAHVEVRGDRLCFTNALSFTARFDGSAVRLRYDTHALGAFAAAVESAFAPFARADDRSPKPGALLYLTKYFTPHPQGEPHFFVKPNALVKTAPGWSTLVEGVCGPKYDVLRGVVRTDAFHATPAVFALYRPLCEVRVDAGAPLLHLFPFPRALEDAPLRVTRFDPFRPTAT